MACLSRRTVPPIRIPIPPTAKWLSRNRTGFAYNDVESGPADSEKEWIKTVL